MQIISEFGKKQPLTSWRFNDNVKPSDSISSQIGVLMNTLTDKFRADSVSRSDYQTVSFIFDTLDPCYQMLATCRINQLTRQLSVSVSLLKNSVKLRVQCAALCILLCRQFNKFNSEIKYGSFRINPFTREISLKMSTLFTGKQFSQYFLDTKNGVTYITDELKSAATYLRYNFYLVLIQIGELEPSITKVLHDQRCDFRDRPEVKKLFDRINRVVIVAHIRYQWMDGEQLRRNSKLSNEAKELAAQISRKKINEVEDSIRKPSPSLAYWLNSYNQKSINFVKPQQPPPKEKAVALANSLVIRQPKVISTVTTDNHFILQKIKIKNLQIKELPMENDNSKYNIDPIFMKSNLANHCRTRLEYSLQSGNLKDLEQFGVKITQQVIKNSVSRMSQQKLFENLSKDMCFKRQTDEEAARLIIHQKKILANIMYNASQFVCRYYFTHQEGFSNKLLMEYSPNLSIDRFQARNSNSISLLSKLFLMLEACSSLRFLHENRIYHLNIQPKNMLVFKNLILKLTDFSNAYHSDVWLQDKRIQQYPPYSAPQNYSETSINFSEKQDVFSLGVTICQIIFGTPLFQTSNPQKMLTIFRDGDYFNSCLWPPQKLALYGPRDLMQTILLLISKCMDPIPEKRPCFQWITVIIQETISYVNKFY